MDYIKNADKSIGKYTNFVGRGFFKKKKKKNLFEKSDLSNLSIYIYSKFNCRNYKFFRNFFFYK